MRLLSALFALALLSCAPVSAQERRGGAPGEFDFYVLALSWSPSFCAHGGGFEKGRDQCEPGAGRGFVLHGLWPQFQRGFPSECGFASRSPSRIAMQGAQGVYPDEGLARHQWRRHGTCSGLSPTDYFTAARRAKEAITIPQPLTRAQDDQRWTPIDIERAFIAANRGLRADHMAVTCRSGAIQEVRICFTRDLRGFAPCPEVDRQACRSREIRVPAAL